MNPGQHAPSFTLIDTDNNTVSLNDFIGKNVLLLFFPQSFTSVCIKELCGVRDQAAVYEGLSAQILGISVDQLNFPLLSDGTRAVSKAYGCLYEASTFDLNQVSKRSAFLIDKQGILRYAEVLDNAGELPDFNAIQKTLAEI
jgi:peroxiredoxin